MVASVTVVDGGHFPTPIEFGVALGVIGLGALLLLLGLKYLPLKPAENSH